MKISFNKLNLKVNNDIQTFKEGEFEVEVKQYLPVEEKIGLIQFVIAAAGDDITNTFSPIRLETFFIIGLIKYYTNVTFTEKQLEDIAKTYDKIDSSGFADKVVGLIPESELEFIKQCVEDTAEDISKYSNSALALIKAMSVDADSLNNELENILEKIKDKQGLEELSAIRDIVN